ncbi:MAG: efflux RND transporter permease subunit [Alphaproteobacteria bacterium]|jgi:HAE1 family hydrophobic/amphiphilic exporter-1|nr:efflux RND transporter permease subunit [Alphaproteobacteria bacterium]
MSLPELGIRRYVMSFMVASVIMLFGIVGYFSVGIDQYPNVDFPFLTVITTQSGADAEVVDETITKVLLEKLNGVPGIDTLSGSSTPGMSLVSISFDLDKDVDVAFNEVQAKISEALRSLPDGIDAPIVRKETMSGAPIIRLALTGNRTLEQLNSYAEDYIQKRFQTINGVSDVPVYGQRAREMRVELDVYKMASYGLTVGEVSNAIQKNHFQLPGGYIVGAKNELLLNLNLEFQSAEELKRLVVKNNGSSFVRLSDIAHVYEGLEDFRRYAAFKGEPALIIGVTKISGTNAFDIEKEVMNRFNNEIIPALEPGLNLEIVSNDVDFIRALVSGLQEHLYLGVFLTAFVVFLFLRSLTSTFIVALSIPISLLGAVFVIYAFGYTFNAITLLGLLLLIGVVVDDSIIVLENIFRKMESGVPPEEAAISGANQIVFAVLAATLSLVAIFGPVFFMGGIIGKFFKSFSVVVVCGVLISYMVALYVTPMLCARYLRPSHGREGRFKRGLESIFVFIETQYLRLLKFALNYRALVLILAVGFFMSSFLFFSKVPGEFAAETDKSSFNIFIQAPSGSNIYYTIEKIREVEAILKQHKEVLSYGASIGGGRNAAVSSANMFVKLVPIRDRSISQKEFVQALQPELRKIVGIVAIASSGGVGGDYGLEFNITGPDLRTVYKYGDLLKEDLANRPEIGAIKTSTELLPQLRFIPNRDKMALLGLSTQDVVNAIAIAIGGLPIAKYTSSTSSERFDLRLKGQDSQFTWKNSINSIFLRAGSNNSIIRIDNVVQAEEFLGFSTVERFGTMFSTKFSIAPAAVLSDALIVVNKSAAEILPPGYRMELIGAAKEFQKTIVNVAVVFGMAIILLYMVLASQFNSFIQPLILMVSVPLAVVGGVFGLFITGFSLNMFSMIGIILLVGLVAKNAILLIDFTNELRREGYSIKDALLQACPVRLRPILMTSLTIILTMLPAAVARGAGSEDNASLAIVIVGGVLSSTLLTLVVVPTLYAVVETIIEKRKNKKNHKKEPIKMIQG